MLYYINLIASYIIYIVFRHPFSQEEYEFLLDSEKLTETEEKLLDKIIKINRLKKRKKIIEEDRKKVICITDKESIYITRGNTYTVLEETDKTYFIKCDTGVTYWYLKSFFIDSK